MKKTKLSAPVRYGRLRISNVSDLNYPLPEVFQEPEPEKELFSMTKPRFNPLVAQNEADQPADYIRLWRSMIALAIKDLIKEKPTSNNYRSAYYFLFPKSEASKEWKRQVFAMAHLNPDAVVPTINLLKK